MTFVLPKISSDEAREILGRRSKLSLRPQREMKKLELLYFPYYLHRVTVSQGGEEHEVVACTDGISSGFSFLDTKQLVFSDESWVLGFGFLVSPEDARKACLDHLRWHLVRQGLRLKVRASATEIRGTEEIHYPYWVAYFRKGSGYDFRAVDAVTGGIEGIRMRRTFLKAFSAHAAARQRSDDSRAAREPPQEDRVKEAR